MHNLLIDMHCIVFVEVKAMLYCISTGDIYMPSAFALLLSYFEIDPENDTGHV